MYLKQYTQFLLEYVLINAKKFINLKSYNQIMHKKQLHMSMHKNNWTKQEIKRSKQTLAKLQKNSKIIKKGKLHYFSNLTILISVFLLTNLSLIPAIILVRTEISLILTAILALVFGLATIPTIIFLEDYHYKHENFIGNIVIAVFLFVIDYYVLNFFIKLLESNKNPLMFALTYTIFFMIPSTYTFIDIFKKSKKFKP